MFFWSTNSVVLILTDIQTCLRLQAASLCVFFARWLQSALQKLLALPGLVHEEHGDHARTGRLRFVLFRDAMSSCGLLSAPREPEPGGRRCRC